MCGEVNEGQESVSIDTKKLGPLPHSSRYYLKDIIEWV